MCLDNTQSMKLTLQQLVLVIMHKQLILFLLFLQVMLLLFTLTGGLNGGNGLVNNNAPFSFGTPNGGDAVATHV